MTQESTANADAVGIAQELPLKQFMMALVRAPADRAAFLGLMPTLSLQQAARRINAPTAVVRRDAIAGKYLAVPTPRGLRFPVWQWQSKYPAELLPGMSDVLRAAKTYRVAPWLLLRLLWCRVVDPSLLSQARARYYELLGTSTPPDILLLLALCGSARLSARRIGSTAKRTHASRRSR